MLWSVVLTVAVGVAMFAGSSALPLLRRRLARRRLLLDYTLESRQGIAERLAGLGAWVHELHDNTLHWSRGSFCVFGIEPAAGEPAPKDFLEAVDPHDRQRWRDGLRRAIRDGHETKAEFRYRRTDGQTIWFRIALRPERAAGRTVRMAGIVQDISAMRSMQRQVVASEAKFRDLTQLSSDWVWETDANHRISRLSESIDVVIGAWCREAIGQRPWERPEADFLSPAWDRYRSLVEARRPIDTFEFSQIAPDGNVFHLALSGRPVFDDVGTFTGYRGTGRNITRERQQRILLELEGEIASIIRDQSEAARAVQAIIAAVCRRLHWLGGLRLSRTEAGLAILEYAGSSAFREAVESMPALVAVQAGALELRCVDTGRHIWVAPLEAEDKFAERYHAAALGARAALAVPIADEQGAADCILVFLSPIGFRGEALVGPIADTLSRTLSLYLRRMNAERQLRHASLHDALTGLPNRANMLAMLDQRLKAGEPLAVLYLDLDRYKLINDTLGHAAGDRALLEVAERIRAAIRPRDMAARMGGDEFVVLLASPLARGEIEPIGRSILAEIEKPLLLAQRAWFLSASIGVAVAPDDARDAQLLLRRADSAMYQVKTDGRNGVRFFSGELSDERSEQLQLAAELPLALERGEVELYYQPVMAIAERRIVCIEALLRWHHPERGMLLPERFLPAAEQSNLIREIGLWVLRRALDDRLRLGIEQHPGIAVSINVPSRQLVEEDFVATLTRVLAEREIPPHLLRIELVESSFVENPVRTGALIERLRGLGVCVVIDNFGTGYASLSYLKDLPVGGLKIDRAFVRGLPGDRGNSAIVQAITTMAARLGMQAMAEGVETAVELSGLRALGCDQVQGSLIAEPMPISEIEEFLETLPALRRMHRVAPRKAQ